ncbi:MAG: DUF262 domain-containing protein [Duncaniella sp.]|nr:DUF262 domain-containing protein [Duncaniella sp.]
MKKHELLRNGEKYPLKDFFSGINEKIIIPDLQRDYCWGDSNLVEKFVDSLLKLDRNQPITLGLIYGYVDNNLIAEHLQLCDGQQRLTTIFLLLGQLYRLTGEDIIKQHLISDFELNNDDREPYLLYAIRESSLYFLSDLTYYYFLGNGNIKAASEIENQPWFLDSYRQDPSIKSMLEALRTIERMLGNNPDAEMIKGFASFMLDKVEFLYVDMNNRRDGEETFVIINTTGEPLTSNENVKPKVIRANRSIADIASKWENMEQWFWINRNKSARPEHTSDEGFEQFVRVVKLMQATSDDDYIFIRGNVENIQLEDIPFNVIEDTFKAYKRVCSIGGYEKRYDERPDYTDGYSEKDLFSLLPTVRYVMQFPECMDEDILRVFHIFRNNARYRNTDVNNTDHIAPAYRAMANVEAMTKSEPADIFSSSYMPADERRKNEQLNLWLSGRDLSECQPIESILARAENNKIFRGRISNFLDWTGGDESKMKFYVDRFDTLWPVYSGHDLDTLRRALLCLNLSEYPLKYPGKGINTFCNEAEHWYSLINIDDNSVKIKNLLDESRTLDEIIECDSEKAGKFTELVTHPEWWERMERANVLIYNDNLYVLLRKERTSSDYWLIYHGESFGSNYFGKGWAGLWKYDNNNGLYCDNHIYDVTIDLEYTGNSFRLILSEWKHKDKPLLPDLQDIAEQFNMVHYDRFTRAFSLELPTVDSIKELSKKVALVISEAASIT